MILDATNFPELTERQEKVLAFVVREYINKPEPVSSKLLADRYLTNVSSATIRNELAALEELGLLTSPHTSSGRVPTETGYRYFVKRLLDEQEDERSLTLEEQRTIAGEFNSAPTDVEVWMRLAVATLVRTAHGAAFVTAPRSFNNQFKHLALISTYGRMVMMVLVFQGGDVRQQMLTLSEAVSQEALSNGAARLNAICENLNGEQIRAKARFLDNELDREIIEIVIDVLNESESINPPVIYREGLSELLPEFMGSEAAQQAIRIMEEQSLLAGILTETLTKNAGPIQVIIAGDGRWNELRHLSMVMSRYGVVGQSEGTLTVLGPMRMSYPRAISAVRYVTGLMSNLILDMYREDKGRTLPNSK